MPLTKSNYSLPKRDSPKLSDKRKKDLERLKYEEQNISTRGAKGSFVVFHQDGLEDVFVSDDL